MMGSNPEDPVKAPGGWGPNGQPNDAWHQYLHLLRRAYVRSCVGWRRNALLRAHLEDLQGILNIEHGKAVTIGGSRFQSSLVEFEMHAGEQLLRFISTAGKQSAFEGLHQPFRLQLERHAALHHRKIGIVVGAHAAHLITAAEAGELNLLTGIINGEGDWRIAG